jgi:hypothetical protein
VRVCRENGLKPENRPATHSRETLRVPGRKTTRSRKRPARPQTTLPAPGRHAARDGKTAQRPARARRVPHSRPQPGPGPGKSYPAWAESRSSEREPFISIQRLREVSGRTKPHSGALAQTLAHSISPSLPLTRRSGDSERPSGVGESAPEAPPEPLAGVRAHRWVNAPPSSASAALLLRDRSPRRGGEPLSPRFRRRRDLGPDHTPTSGGRVLPVRPTDPRPVDLRPTVAARRSG